MNQLGAHRNRATLARQALAMFKRDDAKVAAYLRGDAAMVAAYDNLIAAVAADDRGLPPSEHEIRNAAVQTMRADDARLTQQQDAADLARLDTAESNTQGTGA